MKGLHLIFRLLVFVACMMLIESHAQSTKSITPVKDTSFTLHSDFQKTLTSHPFIRLVNVQPSSAVVMQKNRTYCQAGNRKLLTDVFYPLAKKQQRRTALIIIHGGGWRSGNKELHHPLAQQLALKGYVTFTPEYRLSTEALYPAAVHDIKNMIRWVKSQAGTYHLDTNRIVVAGHSAGGQLAALMGATNGLSVFESRGCADAFSSKIQAVVDMDGLLAFIHPESGEGDDSKKTSAATHWFGYAKSEKPELWKQASPLTHAGPHAPPILFINSAVERMHAGRDDYNRLLDHFGIYHEVKTFVSAPHSFPLYEPWFSPTVSAIDSFVKKVFTSLPATHQLIMVAKDGSGQVKTVQEAFDVIPVNNKVPVTVYVKNGIYYEKLFLDSTKPFVTLIGEDRFGTILTYNDHTGKIAPNGDTINTYTSHSFLQAASDFTARNITFRNDAGFTAGQAVAIRVLGDRVRFFDCRFIGFQDVLFPSRENTNQYFRNCYIEGTTDFIFGPSTAWFEKCHIHSKKNSHITAASTPKETLYGYVFNECILTGDTSLRKVSLGRPWRPYGSVTFINTWMGQHIMPEGWHNWNNTANEKTARYAEYGSFGPGANPTNRVGWSHQLHQVNANGITVKKIFGTWDPEK